MAYDIPQELKYKEIFAYGMTIRQFLYVTVFGVAAVEVISQKSIPQEIGMAAGLGLMGIAVLLGFLNFDTKLLEFLSFLRAPKNITFLDRRASSFFGVKYLKDSAIVLKDGTIIGVVRAEAINFSILSKEQKEAIINNFMNFLNSLGFRAHVIMRTITLDMNQYLLNMDAKVQAKAKGGLAETYSLKDFLANYTRENRVTDRVFYITVPLKNTYGKGKEHLAYRELEERMAVLQEWLAKSMLLSKKLDNGGILCFLGMFLLDDVNLDSESTSQFTSYNGDENVLE